MEDEEDFGMPLHLSPTVKGKVKKNLGKDLHLMFWLGRLFVKWHTFDGRAHIMHPKMKQ